MPSYDGLRPGLGVGNMSFGKVMVKIALGAAAVGAGAAMQREKEKQREARRQAGRRWPYFVVAAAIGLPIVMLKLGLWKPWQSAPASSYQAVSTPGAPSEDRAVKREVVPKPTAPSPVARPRPYDENRRDVNGCRWRTMPSGARVCFQD